MIFGSRKVIKFTNNFKSINYDMIIHLKKDGIALNSIIFTKSERI